ncbi:MAG: FAD-dependent oxidoreductase [Burkholderiales bacterium]|nr:FAD-dependent oxidoreductase [Burkholderiales bacterium]
MLAREDPEVSALLAERFAAEGIAVLVGCEPKAFRVEAGEKVLLAERAGTELRVPFDLLVCALGRAAHTADLGLEDLGIALAPAGTVQTDAYLRTNYPNIYACGDVAGPLQFTHAASHQAATAALNALFGPWYRRRADRAAIPWTTFTDPEVARVGLNETEARQSGVPCEVTRYDLAALDRAIADEAAQGFVKVLTAPGTDRILGATVVGAHAGETIAEIALAIERRIGLARLLGTVHVYPTYAEAVRHAAGAWRRARITRGAQAFLAALNDWRRGAGSARAVLARLLAAAADRRPAGPARGGLRAHRHAPPALPLRGAPCAGRRAGVRSRAPRLGRAPPKARRGA